MKSFSSSQRQRGLSLSGLILALIVIVTLVIVCMQVVPAVIEFGSIKKAIVIARDQGHNPQEIETMFNKQVNAGYITTIRGKDLIITKEGDQYVVSFAYEKKLPLVGPASLLLEFSGSTSKSPKASSDSSSESP